MFSKIAQKSIYIWATLPSEKIFHQKLSKIAQSGHTDGDLCEQNPVGFDKCLIHAFIQSASRPVDYCSIFFALLVVAVDT